MNGKKYLWTATGFVLAASLLAAFAAAWLTASHASRKTYDLLNAVCSRAVRQEPETADVLLAALKACMQKNDSGAVQNKDAQEMRNGAAAEEYAAGNDNGAVQTEVLSAWGYRVSDFSGGGHMQVWLFAAAGFAAGIFLFFGTFRMRNRAESRRIKDLTEYLEQVNSGKALIRYASGEDDFSKLEDEIYKTVTFLSQTREQAVQARNDFARNLSNIAHQIKTPLTSISLSVQRMEKDFDSGALQQVERQVARLAHLEEALLVLSRLDAGTLSLRREKTDVYTLLVLAADNLQELLTDSGAAVEIPELGEMPVEADREWTMEAVMNLMKNCMEHNPGGVVHCSYAQNPLYTEILIWDEGLGFAEEDMPHLFERFYRGRNAGAGGIGIGLALAKEIIERQNGTIRAGNRAEGGALFEIRFYCR